MGVRIRVAGKAAGVNVSWSSESGGSAAHKHDQRHLNPNLSAAIAPHLNREAQQSGEGS
jgi:hypothetical protein